MPSIDINGMKLHYEVSGEGFPLVLQAHGCIQWKFFQVPFFSRHYQMIVFDRRGTGLSDSPKGKWTIRTFADDMNELLARLGIEKAIIGGESLGAFVAAEFGLNHPEKTAALILAGNGYYVWDLKRQWFEEAVAAVRHGDSGLRSITHQPRSLEWEKAGPYTIDQDFARSQIGSYVVSLMEDAFGNSPDDTIRMLEACAACDFRKRAGEFQQLNIPTLVIIGASESQKSVELAYEWHKLIPDSEFKLLAGAPHMASVCNAKEWNEAVFQFLKRHNI